ncbi:MAG: VRR-NUC domain-containing protein [Candidatus Rokuibacteriota bacterium]
MRAGNLEVEELVLVYRQAELDAWMAGDRSLIPRFVDRKALVRNSPPRHFGEMFALRHYHETEGWKGFSSYALGPELPGSARRAPGRSKIEEIVPRRALARLRALRATISDRRFGGGTPDLFLYDGVGRYKFVEVKKRADRLRPTQLRCLAQIARALRCEVDIVYLREANQAYTPKTYILDLQRCEGWRQSSNKPFHPTTGLAPCGRSVRRR